MDSRFRRNIEELMQVKQLLNLERSRIAEFRTILENVQSALNPFVEFVKKEEEARQKELKRNAGVLAQFGQYVKTIDLGNKIDGTPVTMMDLWEEARESFVVDDGDDDNSEAEDEDA